MLKRTSSQVKPTKCDWTSCRRVVSGCPPCPNDRAPGLHSEAIALTKNSRSSAHMPPNATYQHDIGRGNTLVGHVFRRVAAKESSPRFPTSRSPPARTPRATDWRFDSTNHAVTSVWRGCELSTPITSRPSPAHKLRTCTGPRGAISRHSVKCSRTFERRSW